MLFPKIVGQEHAKKILSILFERKHFPPLLFTGPKGVGKRTTAITFAQIINCNTPSDLEINQCPRCQQIGSLIHPDIKIIFPITAGLYNEADFSDALESIGDKTHLFAINQIRPNLSANSIIPIKVIRWIKQEMAYKPMVGEYKIIIILNADKMNQEAANAFLKTLEEPQEQTLFILTTERMSNILPTIRSRSQPIRFSALSKQTIADYLNSRNFPEPDVKIATEIAEGSIRKGLDYLINQDEFLPGSELFNLFDRQKISDIDSLNKIINFNFDETPTESVISGLLFIYRKALQIKLNTVSYYQSDLITRLASVLTTDQIINRISVLLNALRNAELYLNKKLNLFSIFSAVRF